MSEEEDLMRYANDISSQLSVEKARTGELSSALSQLQTQGYKENIVEFQLETQQILEKIEHFLRADIVIITENGDLDYVKNPDEEQIILNDYGVNYIMSLLQSYFNKGTFLSNLEEQRIYAIMSEIATEIRKFTFCNYEKMGMNTPQKVARFPSLLVQVFHMTELALMRAWKGEERSTINSSNILLQSDRFGNNFGNQGHMQREKFNLFKPRTW